MNNSSSGPNDISFRVMESSVDLRPSSGHGVDPMQVMTRIPFALSATIFSTVRLVLSREPCQYMGPHSFKPECLCQAESPRCQCLLHFRKSGASREAKTSVSGASAPSVWIILSYACGAIPYSVS